MPTDPSCTHPETLGRREFLTSAAAALAGASCASGQLAGQDSTVPPTTQELVGDARKRRILFTGLMESGRFSNPYRPNFLGSCCYKGQNTSASEYALRP